ncbi:MAG: GFA family protein [Thalassovita sp.]
MHQGSCACGQVSFVVSEAPRNVSACHCRQCRKMAGLAWASAEVPQTALKIDGDVHWLKLSASVQRGICRNCGAFLFWNAEYDKNISFALSALDAPTGLKLEKHIFTSDKGDYYDISDGLPQPQN